MLERTPEHAPLYELIQQQLAASEDDAQTLMRRAIAVLTSTVTLSGIILASVTVASQLDGPSNLMSVGTPLLLALLFALLAAVLALGAAMPAQVGRIDVSELRDCVGELADTSDESFEDAGNALLDQYEIVESSNRWRSVLVSVSMVVEVAAILWVLLASAQLVD